MRWRAPFPPRLPQSLRWRLLLATLAALALALTLAGYALSGLFADHVQHQFRAQLQVQLDHLTAAFELDVAGAPSLSPVLTDPRWRQPHGGLYWQVDAPGRQGVLRSRSLWDSVLLLPDDRLPAGESHAHRLDGPAGQSLLVLERRVIWGVDAQTPPPLNAPSWRLIVAQDRRELEAAQRRFDSMLAAGLGLLGLALGAVAGAQLALGLAPLRRLQRAVQEVRTGAAQRLAGDFPAELDPLVQDFNGVLARNEQVVQRARQTAGNLAHAIKTPLAVLANAAAETGGDRAALAHLIDEQLRAARVQVDWHLARARLGDSGVPGLRTPVAPALDGLLRVMRKVHAGRGLSFELELDASELSFAGEARDLQEMLGNLLDNAGKWAASRVVARAEVQGRRLVVTVDDDGPGLPPAERERVFERGIRADERRPGSGLGLAIVRELVELYQGRVTLGASAFGGLSARLELPLG